MNSRTLLLVHRFLLPFIPALTIQLFQNLPYFLLKDVVIDGYKVPEKTAVAFMTWFANRDSDVFENPNSFNPERWQHW